MNLRRRSAIGPSLGVLFAQPQQMVVRTGKTPASASGCARLPPPRALRVARSSAATAAMLPNASRAMPSAVISGTPLTSSVPSARVSRAASSSRCNDPTTGRRSSSRSADKAHPGAAQCRAAEQEQRQQRQQDQ